MKNLIDKAYILAFITLTAITFSPLILQNNSAINKYVPLPTLLIKGFIISLCFLALMAIYSKLRDDG